MKKIEIHLAIPLSLITTSCQGASCSALPRALLAILAILHLCLLRYFPSTNLVNCADNCYTSLYIYFSSFFYVYPI